MILSSQIFLGFRNFPQALESEYLFVLSFKICQTLGYFKQIVTQRRT